jgi:hypothetical protein
MLVHLSDLTFENNPVEKEPTLVAQLKEKFPALGLSAFQKYSQLEKLNQAAQLKNE